jgi:predicted outer membrane repeat protein
MLLPLLFVLACSSSATCEPGFADADGDGYGDAAQPLATCSGGVDNDDDCDDADAAVNPRAAEACSTAGVDDDCDGLVDDADLAVVGAGVLHADADGDGHGAAANAEVGCPTAALLTDATDCDDTRGWVFPGAPERCDGVDSDCDPATGEDGLVTWIAADGTAEDRTGTFGGTEAAPAVTRLEAPGALYVCAGDWYARVEIAAAAHLEAPAGPAATTLDAAGTGSVVTVEGSGSDSEVDGFTVTGGAATLGGGLHCSGGATLATHDLVFTGNTAESGGAVASENCTVYLWDGEIVDNHAAEGGAAWVHDGHFEFNGTPVSGNTATVQGGALRVDAGTEYTYTSISETTFEGNSAPLGGAVALSGTAEAQVFATVVDRGGVLGNTAESGGVVTVTDDAMIEFIRADLGEPDTADDNLPTDVTTPVGDFAFGDDVTTWCTATGCVLE